MTVRVGINGFGRIGRSFERVLLEREAGAAVEVVAVNEPNADAETLAFLLEHDSVAGRARHRRRGDRRRLCESAGRRLRSADTSNPRRSRGREHGVEVVVEASGHFRSRAAAAAHIDAGARRVVISAPGRDVDLTVCIGVNDDAYDPAASHRGVERFVHHELPRADGSRARRAVRHRAGVHDDGARLHQ